MNRPQKHILIIDDDPSQVAICGGYLAGEAYRISSANLGESGLTIVENDCPDVIILDLKLPDMHGFEILNHLSKNEIPSEVVVITGHGSMSTAVEAMQLGARDFLVKPFNKERLLTTLNNMFEHQQLKRIVNTYQKEFDRHEYCNFIGSSLAMQKVYTIIDSAADSKATVFITGESGTGKEVCAEAIHQKSNRCNGPFIAINCGAIPKDLIESELFGHVKGAFTGAVNNRDGAIRSAHQGTLFLDEICEMDAALQPKILRFLQTETFNKIGSDKLEHFDVRIVCATNKDPLEQIRIGAFREDLYYRLHVLPIMLPPLNQREGDVLEIANFFLNTYASEEGKRLTRFSSEVENVLTTYSWPGNIRQLQNVVRNIAVLNDGDVVTSSMLPEPLDNLVQGILPTYDKVRPKSIGLSSDKPTNLNGRENFLPTTISTIISIANVERVHIENAIELCQSNIPQAAHYLGISAATIYRKKNSWKE